MSDGSIIFEDDTDSNYEKITIDSFEIFEIIKDDLGREIRQRVPKTDHNFYYDSKYGPWD